MADVLNRFERAVSYLSPRWALQRAAMKQALGQVRRYNAADRSRGSGWIAPSTSINAEASMDLQVLRNRSRDLVRNNPHAAAFMDKMPRAVVGTGIWPRFQAPTRNLKLELTRDWNTFAEHADPRGQLDLYGLQNLAARTMFESGEVLWRPIIAPSKLGLPIPLQIEVLEPDFVDHTLNITTADGNEVMQGVEFSPDGRRVALWVYPTHPGETQGFIRGIVRGQAVRRPITEYRQMFPVMRPGQVHGIPSLAPVALKMRDIADFEEAELVRNKIAACFSAFIKRGSASGNTPLQDQLGGAASESGVGVTSLSPGLIATLPNDGTEVTFASPPQVEGAADFMKHQLKAIAAGLGITYHELTGDTSEANYSSLRAAENGFKDVLESWQWLTFIPQFCQPVLREFLAVRRGMGRTDIGDTVVDWTVPKRRYVDPVKDLQADKDAIRAGLSTWEQVVAERGYDPETQREDIARNNAAMDAAGITTDVDPRLTNKSGTAQQPLTELSQEEA